MVETESFGDEFPTCPKCGEKHITDRKDGDYKCKCGAYIHYDSRTVYDTVVESVEDTLTRLEQEVKHG